MKVFLSGGSGFIAAHILDNLLSRGHKVITSVRTQAKADAIKAAHPNTPSTHLSFAIIPDIAVPNAFSHALQIPDLEAVIHTASPFHFNITSIQKDLLDPAILGTVGILHAIKQYAPSVKHVVITSSFAAIIDPFVSISRKHTYSEQDWNPISQSQALENPSNGYRASKTFAEKAAWDFVEKEKPNFTISTMNPPLVFGPIVHYLNSLDGLNTSNQRIRNLMRGDMKEKIPDTGTFYWVDVRDLALAHVLAIEKEEAAANKRFYVTAGNFSNREIADVIRKNFPEYKDKLPAEEVTGGDYPEEGLSGFDNSRSKEVLGLEYRGLEESIVDLVKSLKGVGA